MSFSFGGATAQPAQTTSLFGNNAAASTSTPAFGSFGASNTQAQPAAGATTGGLFGAQQQKPAGGLFGSAAPAQPAATTTGTTGGLFGSSQQQPAAGASTGSVFGQQQPATTGSLFGQQQQQQQQQPASNSLFGSTQQKPAGGLFGSTTAAGTTATTTQPATSSLFGQPQQQQQQQQPAAGGGLFGGASTTAQPASGSLFGAKPATTGLFGSTAQQPSQPGSGLFGSTAQAQPAAGSLFGSTAQPQTQNQGAMFASTTQQALAQSVMKPLPAEKGIEERMVEIQKAWDPSSPDCRFKYYFYNVVDPGTSQYYGRPAGATDEARWARAVRDNPDPANMVPTLATGWADIQKRVQAQEQTASVHQQRVKEINDALGNLNRQTSLHSSVRLAALQTHLQQLTQRLLHLAAISPSFAPSHSSAFRPEEGEMKTTLEDVKNQLDGRVRQPKPIGLGLTASQRATSATRGRMLGQINELWGLVEEIRRQRRVRQTDNYGQAWAADEKLLTEIAVILEQQQAALVKLGEIASNTLFDADVMLKGLSMEARA